MELPTQGLASLREEAMSLKLRDSHINLDDVIRNAIGPFVDIE